MTDLALPGSIEPAAKRPDLDKGFNPITLILFFGFLAAGLLYVAYSLYVDVGATQVETKTFLPYILLFVALIIALGFEFVNGFHDTANAVATVIYTHSLPAEVAVIWSGFFNFLGVSVSSGAVAFGIISLLPVELILQVGSGAGFAMVFALLIAAIIWNLGTWWFGLPASSSHTLIGSVIGVGVANALQHGRSGTSGVDWGKATEIGYALLLSPIVGFVLAAVNPKNLLLAVAAGLAIGSSSVVAWQQVIAIIIFVLIASCTIVVPVVAYLVASKAMRGPLDNLRHWLAANNATIMAVLMFVIGFVVIGKGIGQF